MDYRKIIPTSCLECAIQVIGWKGEDPDWPSGYVTLLSNHHQLWLNSKKTRLQGAWKILRNREMWPDIELNDKQEVQALIDTLTELRNTLWPEDA